MLTMLEQALEADPALPAAIGGDRQLYFERLFGTKTSLVATLVLLADLILKLDNHDKATQGQNGISQHEPQPGLLAASDLALVESFIKKIQSHTHA